MNIHRSPFHLLTAAVLLTAAAACVTPEEPQVTSEAMSSGMSAAEGDSAGLGPAWDLPNIDHERVDYWIARFDTVPAMRKKFEGFLERGAKWAPMVLRKLEERDMPRDLLYLAMIESGFDPRAASGAQAVGMWQFIAETGQRYGLEIDRAVDERMDPVEATDAALDYLTMLYERFGSWYLAAAAYNVGEGRVGRNMREHFGREKAKHDGEYYEIWDRLPSETRDYVPLMIAAGRITKNPDRWGFEPMKLEPHEWEEWEAEPATPLEEVAEMFGITVERLERLNPHFKIGRTPNDRRYTVRIPAEAFSQTPAAQESVAP